MRQTILDAMQRRNADAYGHGVPSRDVREQEWNDADTLASEFLCEHPEDDEEPLTAEWLEAEGIPRFIDLSGDMKLSIYHFSVSIVFETKSRAQFYEIHEEHELDHIKTRGDLRRLLVALNVQNVKVARK